MDSRDTGTHARVDRPTHAVTAAARARMVAHSPEMDYQADQTEDGDRAFDAYCDARLAEQEMDP